jgi:hypothetical protein
MAASNIYHFVCCKFSNVVLRDTEVENIYGGIVFIIFFVVIKIEIDDKSRENVTHTHRPGTKNSFLLFRITYNATLHADNVLKRTMRKLRKFRGNENCASRVPTMRCTVK